MKSSMFDEEESPKELEIASHNLRVREQWLKKEMSTVGADPKHEKVMDEINQVSLEVGKIESRLMEMGKESREHSNSSKESESAPKGMPQGETEKGDAGGQVASYAGTLMKNVDEGSGSRDPAPQKAIEESAKALTEQREKAQQEREMGEAIYQSMIELSKKEKEKEMQTPPPPPRRKRRC